MWTLWNKIYFIKTIFEDFMKWGLKGGISIDTDSGPHEYLLWWCGSRSQDFFTFIQIGSDHTVESNKSVLFLTLKSKIEIRIAVFRNLDWFLCTKIAEKLTFKGRSSLLFLFCSSSSVGGMVSRECCCCELDSSHGCFGIQGFSLVFN